MGETRHDQLWRRLYRRSTYACTKLRVQDAKLLFKSSRVYLHHTWWACLLWNLLGWTNRKVCSLIFLRILILLSNVYDIKEKVKVCKKAHTKTIEGWRTLFTEQSCVICIYILLSVFCRMYINIIYLMSSSISFEIINPEDE